MTNEVIYAFSKALHSEFPSARKYIEDVPQDLKTPAFLLRTITASRDPQAVRTYMFDTLVSIQYFPSAGREEINDVLDRMQECLEIIEVEHDGHTVMTRTVQTDTAIVDNVLTVVFRASEIYHRPPEGDKMLELETTIIQDEEGNENE